MDPKRLILFMPMIAALTAGLVFIAVLGTESTAAVIAIVVVILAVWTAFSGAMLRADRNRGTRS